MVHVRDDTTAVCEEIVASSSHRIAVKVIADLRDLSPEEQQKLLETVATPN
jgi:hypothetical protein